MHVHVAMTLQCIWQQEIEEVKDGEEEDQLGPSDAEEVGFT